MSARPQVFGIPFSHYCQKAEWGLTQAGISYDYVSISLLKMPQLPKITRTGLVPIMVVEDQLIEGSDRILAWAADHAAADTEPLYPEEIADNVRQWEQWAGDEVGPLARREAYRVAYNEPFKFTGRWSIRLGARLARRVILNILKLYKMRRYEEDDARNVPRIIVKVTSRLRATGTGYLLTDHATAADHAVAALLKPLLYAERARRYHEEEGWPLVKEFIEGIQPPRTTRKSRRSIRESDWSTLERLMTSSAA